MTAIFVEEVNKVLKCVGLCAAILGASTSTLAVTTTADEMAATHRWVDKPHLP